MGRVSCADLAELRSAYLDGALRDADRERVLSHLAGCERCRSEVEELRQVRALLTHRLADRRTENLPEELPGRLLAIAEGSRRRGPGVPGLSGRARRIGLRVTATAVALGLGVVGAVGLGLAAAPAQTLAAVQTSDAAATSEFEDVVPRLPLASQLSTVLSAARPSEFATEPATRPGPASGPELPAGELQALLDRTDRAAAQTTYSGTEEYYDDRDGQRRTAFVEVTNDPARGLQLRAYDETGQQIGSLARPTRSGGRLVTSAMSTSTSLDLLTATRTVTARLGAVVLDRPAVLLEATSTTGDGLVSRWWIDQNTGLVLWQESIDATGRLLLSTGFTRLTVGATAVLEPATTIADQQQVDRATASLTLSRAGDLASAGWACSDRLAGLSLVRLRSDASTSPGVVQMVYSDGTFTVSVIEQHGRFEPDGRRWDAAVGAYVRDGSLPSYSWQSGESVVTVVSDAPYAVMSRVLAALPHEPLHDATTMERVVAGWARILGHR